MNESSTDLQNSRLAEVEYAVVDKSKKNRFTSLPALNGCNGNVSNGDCEDKDPPVPPKKMLHKRFVFGNDSNFRGLGNYIILGITFFF